MSVHYHDKHGNEILMWGVIASIDFTDGNLQLECSMRTDLINEPRWINFELKASPLEVTPRRLCEAQELLIGRPIMITAGNKVQIENAKHITSEESEQ